MASLQCRSKMVRNRWSDFSSTILEGNPLVSQSPWGHYLTQLRVITNRSEVIKSHTNGEISKQKQKQDSNLRLGTAHIIAVGDSNFLVR